MSGVTAFFKSVFGSVSWAAPHWLLQLKQQAKTQPAKFYSAAVAMLLVLAAIAAGYDYYLQLPQPLKVIATISEPEVGHYQDDVEQPTPLTLHFAYDTPAQKHLVPVSQLSAARLDLIGEVLADGAAISPQIAGKWLWQDDNTLTFTPDSAWPAGTEYQVKLDKKLFAADIRLAEHSYSFSTAALSAEIDNLRFYQHPEQQQQRHIVATLRFSHPVKLQSVQQQLSLQYQRDARQQSGNGKALDFSLKSDNSGREVYVTSAAISLPEQEQYLTLELAKGVAAVKGNASTDIELTEQLLVPDKGSFLKVAEAKADIVMTSEQEPQQVLSLVFTDEISRQELSNKLRLYLLPEQPNRRSHSWAPGEVTETVLARASLIQPNLLPTPRSSDSAFGVELDVPPGRSVFVSVAKGLSSVSDFTLSGEFRTVLRAPQYPRQARLVGEGSLLSLSGDKTLQIQSRGVRGVKVTLHKLLPEHLNHFISQSGGDVSQPSFYNYSFNESNISTVHEQTFSLAQSPAKQANYLALPLAPYLDKAGMGVFFVKLTEFDPAKPDRTGQELDKRVVLVTDLGLLVKHQADSSQQLFVMSVASGKPVAGAKVALLGKNGLPVLSGVTDAQGHVSLGKTEGFERERQPVVYLVSRDRDGITDSSFIPYDRYSRQLDYSKFDTSGRYQDGREDKRLSAYLLSDRGIYRPGEQVKLAAIIRNTDLSLAQGALPLQVQVSGPRGNSFWQQKFTLEGRGLHSFSIDTLAQSETGNYYASITLLDSKGNSREHLGSVGFSLEEFVPDTLKISSRFSQTHSGWLSPEDLSAVVQLDNLFGTAAQGRRVTARMRLIPSRFSAGQYGDYQFIAPMQQDKERSSINQLLDEQLTDATGSARFSLPLSQYSGGTYRLVLSSEGFDGSGGRSVQAISSAWLSPLSSQIGVKADGSLDYLKRKQARTLHFIAIDNSLKQIALSDLQLQLIEKQPVSSLVKQNDGTFAYQTIVQEKPVAEQAFSIDSEGTVYTVPTDKAGDFELRLLQNGNLLGVQAFSVVGDSNSSAMLEQNAALSVKLDKTDYAAGDTIELSITAPYTGSGLISIETDKVHSFSWFSADTSSSIQKIRIPDTLEGNAYVNVAYVRASDSDALFISPLSYAVVPFNIDRSKRQIAISLKAPEEIRPGKAFNLTYSTDKAADLLLYGVDEGILQVAGYALPDPLSHYLTKKALQVRSLQMLDLILPEFSALNRQFSGVGGDTEKIMVTGSRMMLDANLNPFARRADKPAVFWLGVVKADQQARSTSFSLPESFSGNVRLMAVAVGDTALGSAAQDMRVRGPFVLTPDVLHSAAPGDEFDVSVTVANGVKGSGSNAPVSVSLILPASLSSAATLKQTVAISEGSEQSVRFRVKAGQTPGEARLRFVASYSRGGVQEEASREISLSIRPATPYLSVLKTGFSKTGRAEVATRYPLHAEFSDLKVAASASPLVLVEGFTNYLAQYPHGCTEQVVSQVFPWLGLVQQSRYQAQWPLLNEKFAVLIQKLSERQQSDGGFSFWPGGFATAEMPSIYVMHFLLAAREQGLAVPDYMYQQGLEYLRQVARQAGGNLYQARARATAIYLLSRSGEVTSNYLTELHERLDKQHQQAWYSDITAVYMAASYQLLQNSALAERLIAHYRMGKQPALESQYLARDNVRLTAFANPAFQPQLSLDAQYLYLLSSHFSARATALEQTEITRLLQPVFDNQYNTIATSYTVLALAAYDQLQPVQNAGKVTVVQQFSDGKTQPLAAPDNQQGRPVSSFDVLAEKLLLQSDAPVFFALSESGYSKTLQATPVSAQLEVVRDYLDANGKVVSQAAQGDELTVRLRVRSLSGWHNNVALVDLLPAGFSVIRSSVMRDSSHWRADYIDIREDRLVYYAGFGPKMTELTYKVKLTAAGEVQVPSAHAASMYDNSVQAITAASRFVITARTAP